MKHRGRECVCLRERERVCVSGRHPSSIFYDIISEKKLILMKCVERMGCGDEMKKPKTMNK